MLLMDDFFAIVLMTMNHLTKDFFFLHQFNYLLNNDMLDEEAVIDGIFVF